MLVEAFDHTQCHIIIRADHRIRKLAAGFHDLLRCAPAANTRPFAVKDKFIIQLKTVFAHGFPAGLQAGDADIGVKRPADESDPARSVFIDQVLRQFTHADRVVKKNTDSAFLRHVDGNMRLAGLLQRFQDLQHFMIGNIVPHCGQHGDHAVKFSQVRKVVNHALADFAVC